MLLKLVDDDHALDASGRRWVREGDRWREVPQEAWAAAPVSWNGARPDASALVGPAPLGRPAA
jgi:hypothetical protein